MYRWLRPLVRLLCIVLPGLAGMKLLVLAPEAPWPIICGLFGFLLWRSTYAPFNEWYVPIIRRVMPVIPIIPGDGWQRFIDNGCFSRSTFRSELSSEAIRWSLDNLSAVPVLMPDDLPRYIVFMSKNDAFAFKMRWC